MTAHSTQAVRVLRCISLVLITTSMLSSIGIIGFSVRFLVELGYIGPIIGTNSPFYTSLITVLTGIVTFVMTPLGLFSMITSRKTMMLTYCVIMICVLTLCFYSAYIAKTLKNEIDAGQMEVWMSSSLRDEYGHPYGEDVDDAWNRLQQDLKCCGVSRRNGSEWQATMWYKSQTSHPRSRVPVSCCTTCEDIHERYCNSVRIEIQNELENPGSLNILPSSYQQLQEDKKVCIRASAFCSSAENVIANEAVCNGHSLSPKGLPRQIFQHTDGCYSKLTEKLRTSMSWFITVNCFYSLVIVLCCVSWFVLSILTQSYPYSVVSA